MDYETLASGLKVSKIGLGAWQFGDKEWGWGTALTEEGAIRIIRRAIELGVNFIDTAEAYGNGVSEEVIGKAISGHGDEIVVATKVSGRHLAYNDVMRAAEGSLKRLGKRTLDLLQVHWPNHYVPISETMRALKQLMKTGKVRYVGLSNFSMPEAREALKYVEIVSNQMQYNLVQRQIENELLPFMRKKGISLLAWSPLAQGALTGKYSLASVPTDNIRRNNPVFSKPDNVSQVLALVDKLREIAGRHSKTVAQVALNWLITKRKTFAIPGAKTVAQLEENVGAAGWRLNVSEVKELEKASKQLVFDLF